MPEVTKHTTTSCFCRARAEPKCLNHGSHNVSHTLLSPSSSFHTSCPHTTTALPAFVREEPAPQLASLSVPLMQVCSATKSTDPDRGSSDRQLSCFSSLPRLLGGSHHRLMGQEDQVTEGKEQGLVPISPGPPATPLQVPSFLW